MNEKNSESGDLNAETVEKILDIRGKLQTALAQVTLALTSTPRYRHQSIMDLTWMVLEPLARDRIAIATPKQDDANPLLKDSMAGVAIWATVSEEVDARIREQIRAGVFPIRMRPEDWTSGDQAWLLDVIAPSRKASSAVLQNFGRFVGKSSLRIHPIVARAVEPGLLEQIGLKSDASKDEPSDKDVSEPVD